MECETEDFSRPKEGDNNSRKPPDPNGGVTMRLSFKDKLMGGASVPPQKEVRDLFKEKKMSVEYVNGNKMLPRIKVDKEVLDEMCVPWKEALVMSLLGKRLGYMTMKTKLSHIWDLDGDFDLLDVDNGFFMVKFNLECDKNRVIGGGPWMIFDHYLVMSMWSPKFISPTAKVTKTLAWIRIPGLNAAFYDESFLMSVAQIIGKPVKVDINTLRGQGRS
ncbi:hypothetical protein OROGR_001448 [Orobanche gracilis]